MGKFVFYPRHQQALVSLRITEKKGNYLKSILKNILAKMAPKESIKKHPDYLLLGLCSALIIFGVFILSSVSASMSQEQFGDVYYILKGQFLRGMIPGIVLGLIAYFLPLSFFKKYSFPLLIANLILLGLVFVPGLGMSSGGATRWINFHFFSVQPSEFFKISFFIYLAAWLSGREKKLKNNAETLFPFLIIVGIAAFLIYKQPNISTLGIILISSLVMYFSAGTPLWQTGSLVALGITGFFVLMKTAPYRLNRFLVFLNPNIDPMGIGYQLKQALITIGSGGILGVGLGMSRQKFGFLPESIGDAIFAIFAEETGFIGAFILIALFLLFAWRGFTIIKRSNDKFSSLLALGIICWITIQAFYNIAAMIGLMPLTGIPLPFISYGGSALTAELIAVGLLLNISKQTT